MFVWHITQNEVRYYLFPANMVDGTDPQITVVNVPKLAGSRWGNDGPLDITMDLSFLVVLSNETQPKETKTKPKPKPNPISKT